MAIRISVPKKQVVDFCERWSIVELAFFGSILRDDFGPDSDVDVLVQFHPQARHGFLNMACMEQELSEILQRKIDMLSRPAVEKNRNYIRREATLKSAEVFYAAQ
ncbi:MAG: nucleotidyltransferase domain-containing protein [Candidatus Dadabacteria bacterium]|nr:nucleotidyltransferase domain-containing protein [Candidatus Dadabacteria bacterium]